MGQRLLPLTLLLATTLASAQQPTTTQPADPPIPPIPQLLHNVERNEKAAEAARNDYTYHVHFEEQDLDGHGHLKKTTTTDAESLVLDGVQVERTVARDGKPLTAKEAQKQSDQIDKEIAKAKERREKRASEGKPTNANGDTVITASRILELGTFSNPRRITLDGRPTLVVDYAGDPNAKTRNAFETIVRDLVGTAWIDEHDQVLVRAQGHFLNDFKLGGGLLADIRRDSAFDIRYTNINHEVWLPADIQASGKIRALIFLGFNGRIHNVMSDYKKFRTSSTIIPSDRLIGPDGQPIPTPSPSPTPPHPPHPLPHHPSPRPASHPPATFDREHFHRLPANICGVFDMNKTARQNKLLSQRSFGL
jgi:hypothetical protein